MFIARLEMIGFKSFAGKTSLEFKPGVMAVVGPNGCGKTNIVDAVRWVLGEQRTSLLRADRMEAVIFNGTAKRRPLGMAEVTLTIDNDKGLLPSPYSEVAVTRRLFRSGESEYLLNRTPCRLRDVHDLFTDTGFSSGAYSIIELAMVEGIISGPTDARRALFEEAAGVSRYKMRRHAAQRRLESTREDLLRVEDIHREVESSYHSLKRQASRARRYKVIADAIRRRLIADLAGERLTLIERRRPLEERLGEMEAENDSLEAEIARTTSQLLSLEGRELSLIERSNRAQDSLKRIDRREAELEGETALNRQRREFLENELNRSGDRRKTLQERLQTAEESRRKTADELEKLTRELDTARANAESGQQELAAVTKQLGAARREAGAKRGEEAELRRKLQELTTALGKSRGERATAADRLANLRDELEKLDEQITRLEDEHSTAAAACDTAGKERLQTENAVRNAETALQDLRNGADKAASAAAKAGAELESARATLQAHLSRAPSAMFGSPKLRSLAKQDNLSPISARIKCAPEHRTALAAALDSILDAFDRESLDAALKTGAALEEGGRAVVRIPESAGSVAGDVAIPQPPPGCTPAADLVENDGELGAFLKGRLAATFLVEDASTLNQNHRWATANGVRLVTQAGELFEPDGVLRLGRFDAAARQVGWSERLKELKKAEKSAQDELKTRQRAAQQAADALKGGDEQFGSARRAHREAEDRLAAAERNLRSLDEELQRLSNRRKTVSQETAQLTRQLSAAPEETADDTEIVALQSQLKQVGGELQAAEIRLSDLETRHDEAGAASSSTAAQAAALAERRSAVEASLERLEREQSGAEQALAELVARVEQIQTELQQVAQSAENLAAQLELLQREQREVSDSLEAVRVERGQLKAERDRTTDSLNRAQQSQKEIITERSRLETEAAALRERLREVDRRLVEDAEFRPADVDLNTPTEMLTSLAADNLAEVPLDKLKVRLQSLGLVNMLALDELEEVEQRFRFLNDQKQDLEKGMEVLEETIDRINVEARRLFRETFDNINEHFQELFRDLFDGGEARITLGEGDPLEAEIRIWATPSGKKLQSMSVLSGGEKALTAIALLFAIYRARPSPFCILDEVDAPLDDANVVRFNKMIKEFARDTQFLIVTHNKRTMEAADCLFGVTLGADGTSQLVSVKIGDDATDDQAGQGDAAAG